MENELATTAGIPAMSREIQASSRMEVAAIRERLHAVEEAMRGVMIRDVHFGVIPGCGKKPSMLKPGAEMLSMMFRLSPRIEAKITELGNGHREYMVVCSMVHIPTGDVWAHGVGSCSTMESKYRWRNVQEFEVTDQPIPRDAKDRKPFYKKQGFGMQKVEGEWKWVRFIGDGKSENPDIADTYNTVLKMAKKRAHIDGTLSALGCSHLFTQDLEDLPQDQYELMEDNMPAKDASPEQTAQAMRDAQAKADQNDLQEFVNAIADVIEPRPNGKAEITRLLAEMKFASIMDVPLHVRRDFYGTVDKRTK